MASGGKLWLYTLLLIIGALVAPSGVSAAGFDCSKAGTKTEKLICKDDELSLEDARLSQLYKLALKKHPNNEPLVKTQREWIRRRNQSIDRDVLLKMYKDRMLELQDPVLITPRSIKSTCDLFLKQNGFSKEDVSQCKVTDAGIVGGVNGRTYHYALYCLVPRYPGENRTCNTGSHYDKRGMWFFVQDPSSQSLRLILDRTSDDIGLLTYHKPEIVDNQVGKFLYIPVEVDGTGHYNDSDYFIWDNSANDWKPLDSHRWLDEVEKHLPRGTSIGSGVWPDLATMTAEIYLYRKNDANCCPSGGVAQVALTVKEGRFSIKSVKVMKEPK